MKNLILEAITKNGIFINDQLLDEFEKSNLKKDFEGKKNYELSRINEEGEIKNISKTLFNILKKDYINDFLVNILVMIFSVQIYYLQDKTRIKKGRCSAY